MEQPERETLSEKIAVPMTPEMRRDIETVADLNERKPPAEIRIAIRKHLAERGAAA